MELPGIGHTNPLLDHGHGAAAARDGINRFRWLAVREENADETAPLARRMICDLRHLLHGAIDVGRIIGTNAVEHAIEEHLAIGRHNGKS